MQNLFTYRVAVGFNTHDGLKDGAPDGVQFCAVLAANGTDACLIAAQLVGCRSIPQGDPTRRNPNPTVSVMVTSTTLLD